MTHEEIIALLERFAQAWNRHDADALVSMMTSDGVFETFSGLEPFGTRHEGSEALRAVFKGIFKAFPDASWNDAQHVASGDRGFSEWTFRGTDQNGARTEVRGVDIFTLRDGQIARKDTFRKILTR